MPHWAARFGNKRAAAKGLEEGFRSGLEEKNAAFLEAHKAPVLFETFKVPYIIPASMHSYTPDFLLPNGIVVETKGRFLREDRVKHLLVKAHWPELDIRFVISSMSTPIGPGASTKVHEWLTKYGYRWAVKLIPEAWLSEPGPGVVPAQVLKRGLRL